MRGRLGAVAMLEVIATSIALALAACGGAAPTPSAPPSTASEPPQVSSPASPSERLSTPTPPAPTSIEWSAADVPASANASATVTIAEGDDGFIAIGFDGGFGTLLWTSADGGRTWRDATPTDFASVGIANVVEWNGMLVGVGRGDTINVEVEEAAVYLSEDGLAWRKVETADQLVGQMIDVAVTDDGLIAAGGVPGADAAGLWHSPDGETWERIGADFPGAFLWSIADGGPGLVAVGWRRNPDPDLAVWTSADGGASWELAPDPPAFAGFEATDVARLPDGTMAMVGSAFDGSGGRIWHSSDGVAWQLADVDGSDAIPAAYARSLTLTPAGLVAVGGTDASEGVAWISTDARMWHSIGDRLSGAYFQSAFVADAVLLATGASQVGTVETGIEAHAQIWFGAFGE